MESILETLFRTTVGFTVLIVVTRLLGKKQLGQLTIFTYITGIALGNMAGDMIVHRDVSVLDGTIALVFWVVLTFIVEYISLKSGKARVILDGEPTIVVKKGEIMQDKLKKQRLNIDDLTMLLRTNNVYSILDVDYAILEPNGQLSILKRTNLEQVTKKDMNIPGESRQNIPTEIIVDGKLVSKNVTEIGLDSIWLDQQIKQANINSIEDVFYAELQMDGSLYIQKMSHPSK